ncbi:MAG: hypothetical protein ABIM30_01195 [candidate division WOR-3 bacterium]
MQYTFNKSNVNILQLEEEIKKSNITIALDHITLFGSELSIFFKDELLGNNLSILHDIVINHTPKPQNNQTLITLSPFASKNLENNLKLFKRYVGIQQELNSGTNVILYPIPYNWVKITGIDIINCSILEKISFEILDSTDGRYSGIPNFKLNQFSFSANLPNEFMSVKSNYDSDLYLGMQIKITYECISEKTIGINFDFNEVK